MCPTNFTISFSNEQWKCNNLSLEYLVVEVSRDILTLVCFENNDLHTHTLSTHVAQTVSNVPSSRPSTMDTARHISVSYLVSTASGETEQVKFCKLSSSAKLQLCNFHTNKFLVRKTCKIKTFTKVDQIIDITN